MIKVILNNNDVYQDEQFNLEVTFTYQMSNEGATDVNITDIWVLVPALSAWITPHAADGTFTFTAAKTANALINDYFKLNKLDLSLEEQRAIAQENGVE